MNIEELKLILETIRSLSGDASAAAYWYFGLEFAKHLIDYAVLAYVVFLIFRLASQAVGLGQDTDFVRECRDLLRIGTSGMLSEGERRATHQAIRKLIEERKQ
jgi:hypothetical protein